MTDVAAFVLARLAEDEQAARAAYDEASDYRVVGSELAELHFVLHKPDRVLAEVAALRAVVELFEMTGASRDFSSESWMLLREVVVKLAAVWRDHPDYDEHWDTLAVT